MIETAHVTDPAAAAVFARRRQRQMVLALIAEERSLAQLSALTGAPLNLLHHHMARFLRLGLVRITRRQSRAGAPIKFYRAVARSFFVPAELGGGAAGELMSDRLRAALDKSLAGAVKGVSYSHDCERPRMRLVRHADARSVAAEIWLELRLSEADARALADEFRALVGRFEGKPAGSGRRYIVHAAIANAEDESR